MKSKLMILVVLITYVFVMMSCSKDDDNNNADGTTSADQVTQIAQNGDWRVTLFNDSGENETSDFNGYTFNFNTDGSLVATNGSNTVTGTWSVTDDSSNSSSDDDGNSTDDDDFNIFFPVPDTNDFEDLNDDWDIISVSDTKIELIDVSDGNGGTDLLTFEKN